MYNTAKSSAMFFNFLKAKDIFYITTIHMSPSIFSHIYRSQRSWGKVMFLHVSVILFTRGWHPSMPCRSPKGGGLSQHALQVSRPTPRGELEGSGLWGGLQAHTQGEVEGSGLWEGSPGPHQGGGGGLQVHTQGCIPACTEADTHPPCRWLLLRAVRILLQCILVV